MVAGLATILTGIAILIGFASMDQDAKLRLPTWVAFAVVVGSLVLAVIGGAVSSLFDWRALSVLVYRSSDNRLYYEFWSNKYYDFLKVGKVPQRAAMA